MIGKITEDVELRSRRSIDLQRQRQRCKSNLDHALEFVEQYKLSRASCEARPNLMYPSRSPLQPNELIHLSVTR